jgi:hypothetical protein
MVRAMDGALETGIPGWCEECRLASLTTFARGSGVDRLT